MSDEQEKELTIVMAPEVQEQMKNDPKAAEALRDFSAMLRQADHAVKSGQYKTFDEALAAQGVVARKFDAETGEEVPGSLHEDLGLDKDDE